VLAIPGDLLLRFPEQRAYQRARPRRHPLILICGAPRSGTTLVYQTLAQHLPVAYFSNLTSVFPHAPLTATRLFQRFLRSEVAGYTSFYGKTNRLSGTNDALYLWDRWFGPDRSQVVDHLDATQQTALRQFFGASEELFQRPLINKNNNLNLTAHLVAECMDNVYFICLNRNPFQLAQSLYRARTDIHGTTKVPYGLSPESSKSILLEEAVQSVCEQVLFFEKANQRQEERLGKSQFWNVNYEDFCRDPSALLDRVANEILGDPTATLGQVPKSFAISNQQRVESSVVAGIEQAFASMGCRP
ncbi:MAG: sulfotransferase, partial [Planctomycetota bacterium]